VVFARGPGCPRLLRWHASIVRRRWAGIQLPRVPDAVRPGRVRPGDDITASVQVDSRLEDVRRGSAPIRTNRAFAGIVSSAALTQQRPSQPGSAGRCRAPGNCRIFGLDLWAILKERVIFGPCSRGDAARDAAREMCRRAACGHGHAAPFSHRGATVARGHAAAFRRAPGSRALRRGRTLERGQCHSVRSPRQDHERCAWCRAD
jgi:hypothetical protein